MDLRHPGILNSWRDDELGQTLGFILGNPPTLSGSEGKRSFERGELILGWRWLLFSHDDDDNDDDDGSDEDVIGNIIT